jgi:hypothetical protein
MNIAGKLLSLLLASTLLLAQTALPALHWGCQHDHSAARTTAKSDDGHRHCKHHHHRRTDDGVVVRQGHEQRSSDDCAACRYLTLSLLASPSASQVTVEQITLLNPPTLSAAHSSEPIGLYRSRAPPALS